MLQELTTDERPSAPNRKSRRVLWVLLLATLMLGAVLAFTAANVVPASKAGDGSGAITGYTVSAVHYALNAADPSTIDAIEFTLDSAPVAGSTITAQAVNGGTWYTCTNAVADITCDTTGTPLLVVNTDQLRVIVAD